jgi:hypothetical protein
MIDSIWLPRADERKESTSPWSQAGKARKRGDLPLRYARLHRSLQVTFGTQIRMTPLPGQLTEALRLVDELAR